MSMASISFSSAWILTLAMLSVLVRLLTVCWLASSHMPVEDGVNGGLCDKSSI